MRAEDQDERSYQGLGKRAIPPHSLSPSPGHSHHAFTRTPKITSHAFVLSSTDGLTEENKSKTKHRVFPNCLGLKRATKVFRGGVPAVSRMDQYLE